MLTPFFLALFFVPLFLKGGLPDRQPIPFKPVSQLNGLSVRN